MIDVDIPRSLAWFESQGGYCDCEIVMNIGEMTADDNVFN